MVKAATLALAALPLAAAFPALMGAERRSMEAYNLNRRDVTPPVRKPLGSTGRKNTGAGHPNPIFDAKSQLVDISPGSGHEFQSPSSSDLRGECPGLNAAANHGFLNRNGIQTVASTIDGLGAAYGMSPDLAAVLAVLATVIGGDPIGGTWSIGGSYPGTLGLLGNPGGILSIHSKYEGDASIIREDAYLADGRVNKFSMRSWEQLMSLGPNYDLDIINAHNDYVQQYSILNNPYYFTGIFAGAVTPAAENFVVNFMSNHTAEQPGGYLDRELIKTFFSVTGDGPGNYTHTYNQERIPDNFYRRNTADAYNLPDVFLDLLAGNSIYPGLLRFGGNTGETNTFTGLNLQDLTGGLLNAVNLLEGDNLQCFILQATQANEPNLVQDALSLLGNTIDPILSNLGCDKLGKFNQTAKATYPGASYTGTGNSK